MKKISFRKKNLPRVRVLQTLEFLPFLLYTEEKNATDGIVIRYYGIFDTLPNSWLSTCKMRRTKIMF